MSRPARDAARAAANSTSSQALRRHAGDAAAPPGLVAAAPGPLQQAGDALRAADLDHRSTGAKSTPRSRLDVQTTQRSAPLAQSRPRPSRASSRSSEPWCSAICPAQSGRASSDRLVPELRLRARVGEHERRAARLDRGDHLRQQRQPEVPGPREALDRRRQQRVDHHRACGSSPRTTRAARAGAEQRAARAVVEVAERRGEAPRPQRRAPAPQPGEASSVCTPRLVPSSSCHSSTTTRAAPANCSRVVGVASAAATGSRAW